MIGKLRKYSLGPVGYWLSLYLKQIVEGLLAFEIRCPLQWIVVFNEQNQSKWTEMLLNNLLGKRVKVVPDSMKPILNASLPCMRWLLRPNPFSYILYVLVNKRGTH